MNQVSEKSGDRAGGRSEALRCPRHEQHESCREQRKCNDHDHGQADRHHPPKIDDRAYIADDKRSESHHSRHCGKQTGHKFIAHRMRDQPTLILLRIFTM